MKLLEINNKYIILFILTYIILPNILKKNYRFILYIINKFKSKITFSHFSVPFFYFINYIT